MSYVDAFFNREADQIQVVERREDGKRHFTEYPVRYTFYYGDQRGKYKSIYGDPLNKISCKNTKDFRKELAINKTRICLKAISILYFNAYQQIILIMMLRNLM